MRKVIHKNFWAWQADDEEKWINEMSAQGWQLLAVSTFRYEFEQGAPNEYCYRMELLENWPTHPKSMEYIRFVEETGAECFGRVKRWVYFRKKISEGPFELFSDIETKLAVNKRYLWLLGVLFFAELCYLVPASIASASQQGSVALWAVIAINAVLAVLVGGGCVKILRSRSALRRERAIRE